MLLYEDHSDEYFSSVDAQIEKLKSEAGQAARQKEKEVDGANEECRRLKREAREKLDVQTALTKEMLLKSAIDNPFLYHYQWEDRDDFHLSPRPSADDILEQAEARISHGYILVGRRNVNCLVPQFLAWQSINPARFGNILVTYSGVANTHLAVNLVNNIVMRMLMAFSPGCLHLSFIDPFSTGHANMFIKRLAASPSIFYNKAMTERTEIEAHLKNLKAKMQKTQESLPVNCRSVVDRNERERAIETPYEVVVIYDSHRMGMQEHLFPLIENGNKSGIYLILMQPETDDRMASHDMARLLNSERFNTIRIDEKGRHHCVRPQNRVFYELEKPVMSEETEDLLGVNNLYPSLFIDEYFRKFAETIEEKEKARKEKYTYNRNLFHSESYEDAYEGFSVPLGTLPDGNEFNFVLNNKDHTHTLMIGKSGSGKTTLLHDILTTATLKYSPASLHLYLYDLKNGLEFSRYKGMPHVQANVATEGEIFILEEPLKKILLEIEKRNNMIKQKGLSELFDYNNSKEDDNEKLPIILLVIDECRYLFEGKGPVQESINDIMVRIARQGRSYGVYLILSSQTIGTSLPSDLKSLISEKFILKSEQSDAGQIIYNSRILDAVGRINRLGQAIYSFGNEYKDLQPYYFVGPKSDELKKWLETGKEKATRHGFKPNSVDYDSEDRPELEKQDLSQAKAMVLGRSINQQTVSLPINKRESGNNLLIVGNLETHEGDAEMNAVRIIVSSLITLKQHYKKAKKPCEIFIINKLDDESEGYSKIMQFDGANHISFLTNRKQVERTLKRLYQKARGEQNEYARDDVYLFILGQQRFRDMREETINLLEESPPPATDNNEVNKPADTPSPATGNDEVVDSDFFKGMNGPTPKGEEKDKRREKISYIEAISAILSEGPVNGIHTIIQVNKIDSLLFGNHEYAGNSLSRLLYRFKYRAVLSMSIQDFAKVAGDGRDGSPLSSDPNKTRVYLFDEGKDNALTLFTPFVIPGIEYIEKNVNQ